MLWTQDRVKLAQLLAEGYEIDATYASPDYLKGGHHIIYIIADPSQMVYTAHENMHDPKLLSCVSNPVAYYEYIVKHEMGKDYTPDTNIDEILEQTWDYGVVGGTYLPDVIGVVWNLTRKQAKL